LCKSVRYAVRCYKQLEIFAASGIKTFFTIISDLPVLILKIRLVGLVDFYGYQHRQHVKLWLLRQLWASVSGKIDWWTSVESLHRYCVGRQLMAQSRVHKIYGRMSVSPRYNNTSYIYFKFSIIWPDPELRVNSR
jgi:hypothetical protein